MITSISGFYEGLLGTRSPFLANLTAAVDGKAGVALILAALDNADRIRNLFGLVSFDIPLESIDQVLHERFGDYSLRGGDIFLILLTGDDATKAVEIAESIRATIEAMSSKLDKRFRITLHFGVTGASSRGGSVEACSCQLLDEADNAIYCGQRELVANRVYGPVEDPELRGGHVDLCR
jgi:diguanylate cyclase (GGDEF)-like protein